MNYMIGDYTLEDAVEHMHYGFDFLKPGLIPSNPGEFVRGSAIGDMMASLKSIYDYIIIDTSLLGLVADPYSLFLEVDIKLLIVRNFKTNKIES